MDEQRSRSGPLAGVRVVELAGLGPAPMAAMMLADMGAEVLRVERKKGAQGDVAFRIFDPAIDILNRSRRVVSLDLKQPQGVEAVRQLLAGAEMLVEGFRPGVLERLGLGPDVLHEINPALVVGRMTGWGQSGPLAQRAGHDINYLSLSGALHAIGEPDGKPVVPLNLVADGGGAMMLVAGMLAALIEARSSGRGQVVDAAMTDCSALLASMIYTLKHMGEWQRERGTNLLDGGAPFYGTYRCADDAYLAIGPIEPPFFRQFLELAGIDDPLFEQPFDRARWPAQRRCLALHLATRTRDEWCSLFEGSDACVSPVLDMDEAQKHPHNVARGTFVLVDGVVQPAPAPRFSRTGSRSPSPPSSAAQGESVLADWGFTPEAIEALRRSQVL